MLTLRFRDFESDHSYHASLISLRPNATIDAQLHDHADFAEFMLVTRGEGLHRMGTDEFRIERGLLTLVRPRDRHIVLPAPGHPLEFVNIAFPTNLAYSVLEGVGVDLARWFAGPVAPYVRVAPDRLFELEGSYFRALRSHHDGPTGFDLLRVLADSFSEWPEDVVTGGSQMPGWMHTALQRMREEENLRLGMSALRSAARVSQSHLSRELRRHTGQTPSQWLTSARVGFAMSLLATTTDSVESIAHRSGFDSISYFGKCFRSVAGITASEYRRQRSAGILGAATPRPADAAG